jgi:diguanylate cyclase (GGDEF)-like protein
MAKKGSNKLTQSRKKLHATRDNIVTDTPDGHSLHSEIEKSKKSIDSEDFEPPSVSRDEIDNLKKLLATKEIEIASGDLASHVRSDESTKDLIGKKTGTYYHDIIFALVQIRLPEEEAERDWAEILKHKLKISKKLKRNVGIHVATLDYYINIKRRVFNPTIIDAHEFADTASRAITDDLTRAYNRHFFDGELKRLFTFAKLFNKSFALLLFDLDHFKAYNDINGHIKGDIALIQTVNIFHAVCGSNSTVCRYGGEEFTIILPNCDLQEAVRTAENVRKAVYDFRFVNEQQLPGERLSISCGVTSFRKDIQKPSEIIEEADIALYRAKRAGRNRIKTFLKQE